MQSSEGVVSASEPASPGPLVTTPTQYRLEQSSLRYVEAHYGQLPLSLLRVIVERAFAKGTLSLADKVALKAFDTLSGDRDAILARLQADASTNLAFTQEWTGRSLLHFAATLRNVPSLRRLLAAGVDVDIRDKNGDTALTLAAGDGLLQVVSELLDAGANVNAQDKAGISGLMAAVVSGNEAVMTALLNANADVNARDNAGATALLFAVARGRRDMAKALISAGADVNVMDNMHMTALLHAVEGADAEMMSLLLDAKVSVNLPEGGFSPLMMAAVKGRCGLATALLEAKANVRALDGHNDALTLAQSKGHEAMVHLLVSAMTATSSSPTDQAPPTADIDATAGSCFGSEAHTAVREATTTAATVTDEDVDTAATTVACAERAGTDQLVDYVLVSDLSDSSNGASSVDEEAHATVSAEKSDDTEAASVTGGESEATSTASDQLVATDAPCLSPSDVAMVDAVSDENEDDVDIEEDDEFIDVVATDDVAANDGSEENVPEADVTIVEFITACSSGDVHTVKRGVAAGLDANMLFKRGASVLQNASESGHAGVVAVLAAAKADVTTVDKDGKPPLQVAAERGHTRVVRALLPYLLQRDGTPQLPEQGKHDGLTLPYLVKACRSGNELVVAAALGVGVGVDMDVSGGMTLLMHAAERGRVAMVRTLIAAKASVNAADGKGRTAFLLAWAKKHTAVIRTLLASGAHVDACDSEGNNPLLMSVSRGEAERVRLLLDAKADVDTASQQATTAPDTSEVAVDADTQKAVGGAGKGESALMSALRHGHDTIAEMLLAAGANVFAVSATGDDALAMTLAAGNMRMTQLLVEHKADVNGPTAEPHLPSKTEAQWPTRGAMLSKAMLMHAAEAGEMDTLRLLVAAKADVNSRDEGGRTPFLLAWTNYRTDATSVLLAAKASPHVQDKKGNSPLLAAVVAGDEDRVRMLIDAKADVDTRNRKRQTMTMVAVEGGCLAIARLLLRAKADLSLSDRNCKTTLEYAVEHELMEVVELMEAPRRKDTTNALNDALLAASAAGKPNVIRALLTAKADLQAVNGQGDSALMQAVRNSRDEAMDVLLAAGAHLTSVNNAGEDALALAVSTGDLYMAELLVEKGARVEGSPGVSAFPLRIATRRGDTDMVKWLVAKGAPLEQNDSEGITPLGHASSNGALRTMKVLLDAKANVAGGYQAIETPLMAACTNRCATAAKMLISAKANVNASTTGGTALMCGVGANALDISTLLLDAKADALAGKKDYTTALTIAARNGNTCIAKLLLEKGKKSCTDKYNFRNWIGGAMNVASTSEMRTLLQSYQYKANSYTGGYY